MKQMAFTEEEPVESYSIAIPRPIESGASLENVPIVSLLIVNVIVPPLVQRAAVPDWIDRCI